MDRNLFIDKIKGVAIILVVWGHCLQLCANYDFWSNRLFIVIYSFHMPFFMAISGYLYYQSVNKRGLNELIVNRLRQLLIPLCIWTAIFLIVLNLGLLHTPVEWLKAYVLTLPTAVWFVWALLICSILTILVNKLLKDSLIAYFIVALIVIAIPTNAYAVYFTKYLLPFFFAGYLVHKYNLKNNMLVFTISLVIFAALLYFWKTDYYIYISYMVTHVHDIHGIFIDCYRYLAGFAGILVFLTTLRYLPDLKLFETLGKYTLGIYIIGLFFNPYLHLLGLHYDPWLYNFVYTPILAAAIIAFCVGASILIGKSKVLNQYLLGGR